MADEQLFSNPDDERAYLEFCENQEQVEKFQLDKPALVCRWRMANKRVPMLNRHIRALSQRMVQGEPLTTNMLSWAKQHVEWSLEAGDFTAVNGVLMMVVDINGNAAMTVGEYEPLADTTVAGLRDRAQRAQDEAAQTGVAPELLASVMGDVLTLTVPEGQHLCGTATLVQQLAQARKLEVKHADDSAQLEGALFLISDEHGIVVAADNDSAEPSETETVSFFAQGYEKLRRQRR